MTLGQPAPDFSLLGTDGKTHSLASVRGTKATILIFACNHCPYVVLNEDRLISVARDFKDRGVGMASINSNDSVAYPDDSYPEMQKRAAQKKFPFPYVHDADQTVARAYGATHTPHLFVFDKNLRLAYTGAIDDDSNYKTRKTAEKLYLRDALEDLIAGRPVRIPQTHAIGCTIKWK